MRGPCDAAPPAGASDLRSYGTANFAAAIDDATGCRKRKFLAANDAGSEWRKRRDTATRYGVVKIFKVSNASLVLALEATPIPLLVGMAGGQFGRRGGAIRRLGESGAQWGRLKGMDLGGHGHLGSKFPTVVY